MDATVYLSIGALLISSASFYVSWRAYHRDEGKLEIRSIEFFPKGPHGSHFSVTVVNKGRRSLFVEKAFLHTKSGERHETPLVAFSPAGIGFSQVQEIEEGKKLVIDFDIYATETDQYGSSIASAKALFNPLDVASVEIVSTTGKRYIRKLSRPLRKTIAEQWHND